MRRYVIYLPSGDMLLRTNNVCAAVKAALRIRLNVFDRQRKKYLSYDEIVDTLVKCKEEEMDNA